MFLSGIHDFNSLQAGFPTKIVSGMTKRTFAWRSGESIFITKKFLINKELK